ncbi:hypothetical protein C6P46_002472 [Rhodotorula mucilaginosa]|uniref:protein-ribulosamine 3-kinase n=1 Tax=Rhodotorula mucilaginosa TaxID=5537 RepID=A0A9P6VTU6_RHOMI|nr:hypothetical protein C6P46_002472 [Rhodotorula mucilaginosa]
MLQHIEEALRPLHPPGTTFEPKLAKNDGVIVASTGSLETNHREYLYRVVPLPATQLEGEAESLKRINEANLDRLRSDEHQRRLAELVAQLHLAPAPASQQYGFPIPTCCGATVQDNTEERDWATFFGERRIGDLIRRIGDAELEKLGGEVQQRVIPHLLGKLDIKPSLLHGDLWSGNARFSRSRSQPIIFDPASYYGHSEADLGIMHMFGGFSPAFFQRYHQLVPRSEPREEYEQRVQLYEAYHHLNHALLFGGSYKSGAVSLLRGLLSWADGKGLP